MSMREQIATMWERAAVIFALCLIGASVAYYVAVSQPPSYESRTVIALGPKATSGSSLSSSTQALYDRSVPSTLAQIATSSSVGVRSAQVTGIDPTTVTTTAAVANDANAVEVTVTGANPDSTRRLAMQVASQAMMRFNQLYPIFRTVNIGPAALGTDTSIAPPTAAVAGGLLGLFLGSLIALGLGHRQRPLTVVHQTPSRAVG